MKQSFFLFFFALSSLLSSSQEYTEMKLSQVEVKKGIQKHYQWNATDGHFMVFDIILYKNGQFNYSRADNLYPEYSEGRWRDSNGKLILRSTIQRNKLPVKVNYIPVDSNGKRRIAEIRNLRGDLAEAYVLVNADSLRCFDGDGLCNGTFDTISRVKVGLENSELQSAWINVKIGTETIQLVIDTKLDMKGYTPFNKIFVIKNKKIIEQHQCTFQQ